MQLLLQRSWPALCLISLLALAYGPTVLAGGLLATGDALGYYLPARAIAAASLLAGEWPFWNPFNFAGMPLLAAFQGGALYPGNLPFLFLPPGPAMNLTVVAAYLVAGLATYAYARALLLPPAAALLAGACFMGSGYMVGHFEHLTMLQGAAMLPAMCWAIERHAATGYTGYLLALAAALCLQVLAGYPQTVIVSLLFVGPYALWRRGFKALPVFAALALGSGLAALQWLPAAALLAASPRGAIGYEELVATALPPRQLASLLFPFLFGAEPSALFPTPYWGGGTWPNELTGYMGLLPLMLAVAGLGAWRVIPAVRFWVPAGAIALVLSLGAATPVYRLWALIPGLKIVRVPGRHLLEVDLAIALLAGCGLAWLLAATPAVRRRWALLGGGSVALGLAAIAAAVFAFGPATAKKLQPLMPPGTDLATTLSPLYPAVWLPLVLGLASLAALAALSRRPTPFRQALVVGVALADLGFFGQFQGWRQLCPHPVEALPRPALFAENRQLAVHTTGYPYHDFAAMRALGYPMLGALWGVRSVGGYEPMLGARYGKLVGNMTLSGVIQDFTLFDRDHQALDVLACREVRLSPELAAKPEWRSRLAPPRWRETAPGVFGNTRALPLAWRPDRAVVLSPALLDAVMRGLPAADPAHPDVRVPIPEGPEFSRVAVYKGRLHPARLALLEDRIPHLSPGPVAIAARGFGRLALQTDGSGPGLLAVSEGYDPGWHATTTDGTPLTVHRLDGLILGVEVPAGPQQVLLRYEPPRWREGLALSLLSGVAGLAWAVRGRRRVA